MAAPEHKRPDSFPGDSELARRMRAMDWPRSPLGPVEEWPRELVTSVGICLDCAFPAFIFWGPDLALLYNDACRGLLGPRHPGALGKPGASVWTETWEVMGPLLSRILEQGEATRSQDRLLHLDGGCPESSRFSLSSIPIRDRTGKTLGLFCTLAGNTLHGLPGEATPPPAPSPGAHAALASLPAAREPIAGGGPMLSAIVESSDDAIISKDLNGVITSWNRGAEKIFGYTREEAIGQPVTLLIPPERFDEEPGILARIRRGERIDHYETVRRRKDGSLLDISLCVSPLADEHGTIVGASKIARDITDRKRVERALQQQTLQLSTLLNQAPIGVYLVDADFRIRLVNPVALPAFGTLGELIGRDFDEAMHLLWVKEDADDLVRLFRHALDTGEAYVSPERKETRLDCGVTEYHEWHIERIELPEGRHGVVCYFRDITPHVVARQELQKSKEALRDADRRKDNFLAMLAHELRNPLAAIRGAADLMKMIGPSDKNLKWSTEVISRQANHLTRMVDDLLDVSRITRGKVELRKEVVDLSTVVASAVEMNKPLLDAKQQQLSIDIVPIALQADEARLTQVLSNLLNNAAKYTQEGGRIAIHAREEGETATIRVKDSGPGIAPQLLASVFDLFTQGELALDRPQGGLGIGLTIVKSLVDLHGGRISVESERGRGAEFVVTLPALKWHAHVVADQAEKKRLTPTAPKRVLIVDDNEDAARAMTCILEALGHDVRFSADGPSALEIVEDFEPEVVLLDIGLPGMSGYEVARRLKKVRRAQPFLLVAMTGYGQEEDKNRALAAGFDLHLTKPLSAETVEALLQRK